GGITARAVSSAALPHASTASAAREQARAVLPASASSSASCSRPCAFLATATAYAASSGPEAAFTAARSTLATLASRHRWPTGRGPAASHLGPVDAVAGNQDAEHHVRAWSGGGQASHLN